MAGLGEEVEGLNFCELVAIVGEKELQIADLGGGVAGNIDDGRGSESQQLIDESRIGSLAWRVNDHGSLISGKGDAFKNG